MPSARVAVRSLNGAIIEVAPPGGSSGSTLICFVANTRLSKVESVPTKGKYHAMLVANIAKSSKSGVPLFKDSV